MENGSSGSSQLPPGVVGVAVDFDPFDSGHAGSLIEQIIPPTEAQREVWLAARLGREASLAYNEAVELDLRGPLDEARLDQLRAACQAVFEAHPSLRAVFSTDGSEMQVLPVDMTSLPFELLDLRTLDEAARTRRLHDWRQQVVNAPFDLTLGPLFRAHLLWLADDHAVLLLSAHHLVCDGYSFGRVLTDFCRACRGEVLTPSDYGQYAEEEAEWLAGDEAAANVRYWTEQYARDIPVLDLPTDHPRPARRRVDAARVDHLLDAGTFSRLQATARQLRISLFSLLLGGFELLLSRLTGNSEVVVGVPAAGQIAADQPDVVGHCVNLLPVRGQVDAAASTRDWLTAVQSRLLDAFDHQRFTFGTLLTHLPLRRDPSRLPLVPVMFNLDQRLDAAALQIPGLRVGVEPVARSFENFELFVNLTPLDTGLRIECQYSTALFDATTIHHWLQSLDALLVGIADDVERPVGQQPALGPSQQALLRSWNDTVNEHGLGKTPLQLLDRIARAQPRKIALADARHKISYQQLIDASDALARRLQERGIGPDALVGLCVERGVAMVIAQWAIWRTGAAYVPLDPGFPQERLAYMAEDARLALIVADDATVEVCQGFAWPAERMLTIQADELAATPATDGGKPPLDLSKPEAAAYVIYTSGSTGKPKGVSVPHRATANLLLSMQRKPGIRAADRLLAVTTLSFDIAVLELLTPLIAGGHVFVADRDDAIDGHRLATVLAEHDINVMQATPGTWRLLLGAGWQPAEGFRALVGGEPLPQDLADALSALPLSLWNMYGPTETTVWSTCWQVPPGAHQIRIGGPIANTRIHVRDAAGQDVPFGAAGEIVISGEGVAIGYLGRPELTAERFVPDPESPGRSAYRTGDSGRWRNDGTLEHLGRLDHQVKVRGYRIELGEIEAVLASFAGIAQVVTIVREDTPGDQRLVAYLVGDDPVAQPREADREEAKAMRAHLRQQLPDYMVPQHFVWLPAFGLLPNGKIDRKQLPRPDQRLAGTGAPATETAPASESLQAVARLMAEHLRLPQVDADDDFFALGGHSLLAAQFLMALGKEQHRQIPLALIFEAPTARQIDAWLKEDHAGADGQQTIARRTDTRSAPLSVMQQRLYFLESLNPGTPVYNTPSAHRLFGPLDEAAFQRAFDRLIERQPILRTCIDTDARGMPVQRIADSLHLPLFPAEDLSQLRGQEQEAALAKALKSLVEEPIPLHGTPLFRTRMFRLGDERHVWFFMPHHIIWDGWSFDLLYQEMAALYRHQLDGAQGDEGLPPLGIDYGDFALWHNQFLQSGTIQKQVDHWLARIDRNMAPLELPADRPRPPRMSGRGGTEWVQLPASLVASVREQAMDRQSTLFMSLLGTWALLLHGLSGQDALAIGTPVRGRELPELEPVMGFFVNALPLGFRFGPQDTVQDLLTRLRQTMVDAFGHADVPVDRILQALGPSRDESRPPLWQAFFSFQEASDRQLTWGNLEDKPLFLLQPGTAEDVGLWFLGHGNQLVGGLQYNVDIFDALRIRRLGECYQLLLTRWSESTPETPLASLLADIPALFEHGAQPVQPEPGRTAGAAAEAAGDGAQPASSAGQAAVEATASATGASTAAGATAPAASGTAAAASPSPGTAHDASATPASSAATGVAAGAAAAGDSPAAPAAANDDAATATGEAGTAGRDLSAADSDAAATDGGSMQQILSAVWADLLGTDDIRADDNFFDLGGHSMLVMQALAQMQERTGRRVNPRRFIFETLAQVARAYEEAADEQPAPAPGPAAKGSSGLVSRMFGAFNKRRG
ncbi:MAG: amino acid adenylation domain-containing protein [Lautropia sp.]|nr:amino acid adenylation domain-containing protein [Lautropia sp.]